MLIHRMLGWGQASVCFKSLQGFQYTMRVENHRHRERTCLTLLEYRPNLSVPNCQGQQRFSDCVRTCEQHYWTVLWDPGRCALCAEWIGNNFPSRTMLKLMYIWWDFPVLYKIKGGRAASSISLYLPPLTVSSDGPLSPAFYLSY